MLKQNIRIMLWKIINFLRDDAIYDKREINIYFQVIIELVLINLLKIKPVMD